MGHEGHYIDAPELASFVEMMNWGFAEMQKVRCQERDGLDQLNAGTNGPRLGSDEIEDTTDDTSETTPADHPSPSTSQPTATEASRKSSATVILSTPSRASVVTIKVVERHVRHPDLPTGMITDGEDDVRPAADSNSSTTIAL